MTPTERNARLRQAADWVRNDGIVAPDGKPLGFNMGEWSFPAELAKDARPMTAGKCGTVACIAGTIYYGAELQNGSVDGLAARWLDLEWPDSSKLFLPKFPYADEYSALGLEPATFSLGVAFSSISPELAARVLEDMADRSSTEADWAGVAQRMIEEAKTNAK